MTEWRSLPLRELADPIQTWNPLRSPFDTMFQYIDISAVDQGTKSVIGPRDIPCGEAPSRARQLVKEGDVIVSTVRPNLNAVARIPKQFDGATASTGFCVIRPRKFELDSGFLFHWVKSPSFIETMVRLATGATYPAVSDRIILDSHIPRPPLAEQQRIARILDQIEVLRAERREAVETLNALANALFIESFGDPVANPKHLPLLKLGEMGKWQSGGTPPRSRSDYFEGSVPWFSSGELNEMFLSQTAECLSHQAFAETSAKLVPPNALLLGMYDTAALKAGITTVECSCNQAVAFGVLNSRLVDPIYVYFAITIGREHFRRFQRGVRQKNLNLSMVRDITIPLPRLELQAEFVERIRAIENVKRYFLSALSELDALFTSLQHRAFRGEL